jgi:hypothetical protein
MTETLRLIRGSADADWARWLHSVPHDFYHTAAYHRFSECSGEGEAWLAVYGSEEQYLAWPYLLRKAPVDPRGGDLYDITSVYGYPGPLVKQPSPDDLFLERAGEAIARFWITQKVVSVFSRFHPLVRNFRWPKGTLGTGPAGGVTHTGTTISIDLTASEEENWRGYQPSLRSRIRGGWNRGVTVTVDESWSHLGDFVKFYHAAMARNLASPYYFFPEGYFLRLREAIGSHAVLMVARLDAAVAAAGIFIEYRGIVQNHFCVNNPEFLDAAPSKVLLDDVRRWARSRGNSVFHLGGGRGGCQDSLFAFKAAFSTRRHPFHIGRWILNKPGYERLCSEHAGCNLLGSETDFFPAYRRRAPIERIAASA